MASMHNEISHRKLAPYGPKMNGPVEEANKYIKMIL